MKLDNEHSGEPELLVCTFANQSLTAPLAELQAHLAQLNRVVAELTTLMRDLTAAQRRSELKIVV